MLTVARVAKHPGFNRPTRDWDVALRQLDKPVRGLTPYRLFLSDGEGDLEERLRGQPLEIRAQGMATMRGIVSADLWISAARLIPRQTCMEVAGFSVAVTERTLCALGDRGAGVCVGAAGSPLVWRGRANDYLVGLSSWGIFCGQEDKPSVFTSVPSMADWVQAQISTTDNRWQDVSGQPLL